MALCVCGWEADSENAMSIRPGQVIKVSESEEHWSRGRIWEDRQVATMRFCFDLSPYTHTMWIER